MKSLAQKLNPEKIIAMYETRSSSFWLKLKEKYSLALFHQMAKKVPAYRKFLKKHKVNPGNVRKYSELKDLPNIDKKNYFHQYSLDDCTWEGTLKKDSLVVTATSGSTGKSTYFVRSDLIDQQYSVLADFFLRNGPKGSTLLVNCFGMGVWIGGLITYQAFRYAGLRGHPITIIAPGINKKEIFGVLREMGHHFDNVILSGYPPFIKDIIDEAKKEKIDFSKFNLRLLFAAESFTENFRDYVVKQGKIKNVYKDTLNIYGTAELGAQAFETPTAVLIRRLAVQTPEVYEKLFNKDKKIPTLAQFNPLFVSFDAEDGNILITANSAMPLFRYRIGDFGGVLTLEEISESFKVHGIDLQKEARKNKITLTNLPFVFVHERTDFSTTLYGLQVYPQTIKRALEKQKFLKYFTGKFTMLTVYDKRGDQYLEINLECKPGYKGNKKIEAELEKSVVSSLLEFSSEYKELTRMLSLKRTKPRLVFWEYNDDKYFKSGIKQKWLIK